MANGEKERNGSIGGAREQYEQAMLAMRRGFEEHPRRSTSGTVAVGARAAAVDALIGTLWAEARRDFQPAVGGTAVVGVGGYGRQELFPYSDVDLMFLVDPALTKGAAERDAKDLIRRLSQQMWDCGLRLAPTTRTAVECERFQPENVEFTLALLDARFVAGDRELFDRLAGRTIPKLLDKQHTKIVKRLAEVTWVRHRRYGNTLFHLEPNIKDCPGGLRDAHVCAWMKRLEGGSRGIERFGDEYRQAREFLLLTRAFLHLRHGRDDNTLDWHAQDQAAAVSLGLVARGPAAPDAAYWMRMYFRHARSIERAAAQALEEVAPRKRVLRRPGMTAARRLSALHAEANDFEIQDECLVLRPAPSRGDDPAHDPEVMLEVFASVAHTGCHLSRETEQRLEQALPLLSAHLEDGPGLWRWLERILTGAYAGHALRAMHAMGILELVMPEFHGIDALVIRDAYHRYTVDEHTFVLIDTMHGLLTPALATGSDPSGLEALGPEASRLEASGLRAWGGRFATILRDLPHPGLLFLAALLHDTGKGHSMTAHAAESVRMAENVVTRLELDAYERDLVLGLIRNHLEMSSALRRDVFEAETVRTFAARVPNPEALRMLTVFTYADISAVHPDALTPWKAENLHHLYVATAHFLDRNVDDERIGTVGESAVEERMHRVLALLPEKQAELQRFLAGFPQRYLLTRTPEEIRRHFAMAQQMEEGSSAGEASHAGTSASGLTEREVQLDFHFTPESSELTLVSRDRPMLFANMAGVLAAWGMNIVSANAFSNADGIVVDRFRFTDGFRTLELNVSERSRFVESIREALVGTTAVETMLAARQRSRRKTPKMQVKTHVGFDDGASTRSTVLEVIAQDTPGLLRALTLSLAAQGCNIEVALVDTEGEMAIDVFYVTRNGAKLEKEFEELLGRVLAQGVEANAS